MATNNRSQYMRPLEEGTLVTGRRCKHCKAPRCPYCFGVMHYEVGRSGAYRLAACQDCGFEEPLIEGVD